MENALKDEGIQASLANAPAVPKLVSFLVALAIFHGETMQNHAKPCETQRCWPGKARIAAASIGTSPEFKPNTSVRGWRRRHCRALALLGLLVELQHLWMSPAGLQAQVALDPEPGSAWNDQMVGGITSLGLRMPNVAVNVLSSSRDLQNWPHHD